MKTTEIRTIKIEAEEGKILTDGNVYGTVIFLGKDKSAEDFHEIPKEEYEKIAVEEDEKSRKEVEI